MASKHNVFIHSTEVVKRRREAQARVNYNESAMSARASTVIVTSLKQEPKQQLPKQPPEKPPEQPNKQSNKRKRQERDSDDDSEEDRRRKKAWPDADDSTAESTEDNEESGDNQESTPEETHQGFIQTIEDDNDETIEADSREATVKNEDEFQVRRSSFREPQPNLLDEAPIPRNGRPFRGYVERNAVLGHELVDEENFGEIRLNHTFSPTGGAEFVHEYNPQGFFENATYHMGDRPPEQAHCITPTSGKFPDPASAYPMHFTPLSIPDLQPEPARLQSISPELVRAIARNAPKDYDDAYLRQEATDFAAEAGRRPDLGAHFSQTLAEIARDAGVTVGALTLEIVEHYIRNRANPSVSHYRQVENHVRVNDSGLQNNLGAAFDRETDSAYESDPSRDTMPLASADQRTPQAMVSGSASATASRNTQGLALTVSPSRRLLQPQSGPAHHSPPVRPGLRLLSGFENAAGTSTSREHPSVQPSAKRGNQSYLERATPSFAPYTTPDSFSRITSSTRREYRPLPSAGSSSSYGSIERPRFGPAPVQTGFSAPQSSSGHTSPVPYFTRAPLERKGQLGHQRVNRPSAGRSSPTISTGTGPLTRFDQRRPFDRLPCRSVERASSRPSDWTRTEHRISTYPVPFFTQATSKRVIQHNPGSINLPDSGQATEPPLRRNEIGMTPLPNSQQISTVQHSATRLEPTPFAPIDHPFCREMTPRPSNRSYPTAPPSRGPPPSTRPSVGPMARSHPVRAQQNNPGHRSPYLAAATEPRQAPRQVPYPRDGEPGGRAFEASHLVREIYYRRLAEQQRAALMHSHPNGPPDRPGFNQHSQQHPAPRNDPTHQQASASQSLRHHLHATGARHHVQSFPALSPPNVQTQSAANPFLPTTPTAAPSSAPKKRKREEDDDSRSAKKFQSKPKGGRKEYRWTESEKQEIGRLMREIIDENKTQGDRRFEELARRLEGFDRSPEIQLPVDAPRTAASIRNYWNRYGRAAHNLDERSRATTNSLVTGRQDPGARKVSREEKKGQRMAKEGWNQSQGQTGGRLMPGQSPMTTVPPSQSAMAPILAPPQPHRPLTSYNDQFTAHQVDRGHLEEDEGEGEEEENL
ncbi:MAG: hypothetical protein MMC33_002479 [Icmadophila ericetorum]|nr:hypothetical protein [Icmadophila ericetorum]